MFKKEIIEAVGFDLDETIYQSKPEINDIIRNEISKEILTKRPELKNLEKARQFFEMRYSELHSGTKVLIEIGYSKEEANLITDRSVSQADIITLLEPDPTTARIIKIISERYFTYLITSSPRKIAIEKLNALAVLVSSFHERIYGDDLGFGFKQDGIPFYHIIDKSKIIAKNHVYIGNSAKSDIIPAKKAGMQTIAVWSQIPEADISINHIHELERILL